MKEAYHIPVLLEESLESLCIKPNGIYVDATFGGGGHSKKILKKLENKGRLFAFDHDSDASKNQIQDERLIFISENFRYLRQFLEFYDIQKVDGILADLGISSYQIDTPKRGFSIRFGADLDMRMDLRNSKNAFQVLQEYKEQHLANLFENYGELTNAKTLAKTLVATRKKNPIKTTFDLKKALQNFLPKGNENKILAKIFQAIRIEVNDELGALKEFLRQIPDVLNEHGRLCVISYHSLEDRLVKRFIKYGNFSYQAEKDFYGNTKIPLKQIGKIIKPSFLELKKNNRARSAKLRVAKKTLMD